MGNMVVNKSRICLKFNGSSVGVVVSDDVEIVEDSFLFGGENVNLYDVWCYLEGKLVYSVSACSSAELCFTNESGCYDLYIEKQPKAVTPKAMFTGFGDCVAL